MGDKRIFLLDDDADFIKLQYCLLKRYGYDLRVETSPVDAYPLIVDFKPHLVISDYRMPDESDGLEFIAKMKGNVETRGIPLMVMSNDSCKEHVSKIFSAGADYFMYKFHTHSGLVGKIVEILNHHYPDIG